MANYGIRHLPVVETRRLVGIVTDRDLRQASPSSATSLSARERDEFMDYIRVGQIMTRRVVTVTPVTPVGDAARLFLRYGVGCLPVVEGRLLVGILTTSDLLEVLTHMLRAEVEGDRVEVEVPDAPPGLESMLRIAGAHRARMVTLVNVPTGEGFTMQAVLSIEGDAETLCAALAAAGFRAALR